MKVVAMAPYQTLGRMEEQVDQLLALGLTRNHDAVLIVATRFRELCEEMHRALGTVQRHDLESQLISSIEFIQRRQRTEQERCKEIGADAASFPGGEPA